MGLREIRWDYAETGSELQKRSFLQFNNSSESHLQRRGRRFEPVTAHRKHAGQEV
jgi:hypothetical protein